MSEVPLNFLAWLAGSSAGARGVTTLDVERHAKGLQQLGLRQHLCFFFITLKLRVE